MFVSFFLMLRQPPRTTRTDTPFPYATICRSAAAARAGAVGGGAGRDRAAAAAAAVPRAPGVRAGTLAVPRARRQRGQLSRWRFQQRRLLAGARRTARAGRKPPPARPDRKSVVEGTRVSVGVDFGGRRIFKKKKNKKHEIH